MFRCKDALGGVYKLNNGNLIPLIGLGTWRNKSQVGLDIIFHFLTQETVDRAVRVALQEGYRLIDTAHMYKNEEFIGKALERILPDVGLQREDIFITTKVPTVDQDCEKETRRLLQESLGKLRVKWVFHLFFYHFEHGNRFLKLHSPLNSPNFQLYRHGSCPLPERSLHWQGSRPRDE